MAGRPGAERRAHLTPPNPAESDAGVGLNDSDVRRGTFGFVTRTGDSAVEPAHVATLVPPDAHSKNHTAANGLTHLPHTTKVVKGIGADGPTEGGGHGVCSETLGDKDGSVLDDAAVLNVQAADFEQFTTAVGGELRDDGHGLVGVDIHALSVIIELANAVRVIWAAVLVTDAIIAALGASALVQAGDVARVRGDMGGSGISLPDIKFVAASSSAGDVSNTVYERSGETLRIAVSGSEGGTAGVERAPGTIGSHLREIQSTVHSARKPLHVNVERELAAEQVEHLITIPSGVKKIDTRAHHGEIISQHVESQTLS